MAASKRPAEPFIYDSGRRIAATQFVGDSGNVFVWDVGNDGSLALREARAGRRRSNGGICQWRGRAPV